MSQQLMTVDLLKAVLPKNLHVNATQEFADTLNTLAAGEPELAEEIRANFMTYSKVLTEGRYKTEDYLRAVTYVTHKLMGYNNADAYLRTFPERHQALVARGCDSKTISAYVAAYHKNKLVNSILEQSLIPAHVLYQDAFHAAVQTQMRLMASASSEKVQSDAANSILTHLKAPEVKKVEIDVGVRNTSGLDDLRATMEQLAKRQLEVIDQGLGTAGEMAKQRLVIEHDRDNAVDVTPSAPITPAVSVHSAPEDDEDALPAWAGPPGDPTPYPGVPLPPAPPHRIPAAALARVGEELSPELTREAALALQFPEREASAGPAPTPAQPAASGLVEAPPTRWKSTKPSLYGDQGA